MSLAAATLRSERPEARLERHRAELTAFARRMLGSAVEAEDAVQETYFRAWRSFDRLQGHASLRPWLYRIARNVCLDMLSDSRRRAWPMDLEPLMGAHAPTGEWLPGSPGGNPVPTGSVPRAAVDPAEVAISKEAVRSALTAALQSLPPRQRSVVLLRDVLRWRAAEVAELLDTTVASVNSALQRARTALAARHGSDPAAAPPMDDAQRALLARYVDAFERYDLDELTALLNADKGEVAPAAHAMPEAG